jgi:hypothetical protein
MIWLAEWIAAQRNGMLRSKSTGLESPGSNDGGGFAETRTFWQGPSPLPLLFVFRTRCHPLGNRVVARL